MIEDKQDQSIHNSDPPIKASINYNACKSYSSDISNFKENILKNEKTPYGITCVSDSKTEVFLKIIMFFAIYLKFLKELFQHESAFISEFIQYKSNEKQISRV